MAVRYHLFMGMASGSGDLAEIVTTAWVAALSLETAERGGSFLSQGGDSLRAMDLRARLLETIGYAPDLPQLLGCAGLPQLLETVRRGIGPGQSVVRPAPAPTTPSGTAVGFSFAQDRLAFMHELAGASAAYHIAQASRLRGKLRPAVLRSAYEAVCARHPTLTRAASLVDGKLRAAARPAAVPDWREFEWPVPEPTPALQDWLCEFSNAPIQFERGPLLRAALLRLADDDWMLLLVAHHAVLDQWSMENLLVEIAAGYRSSMAGVAVETSPAPDFAAYGVWHRTWLERERREVELAFWERNLSGVESTVLPEDYARPAQQSFRGARERVDLHLRDIVALRRLGASQGASLAMVMLAALKLLLARYTGNQDIAVGMPVAGRHHPHARHQMGSLLNTVVVRSFIDPGAGLHKALATVKNAVLDALAHQDVPFDQVVQHLRVPRDPSRPTLFSVMFNMLNTPFDGMDLPEVEWSRVEFDKRSAQFDLQVTVDHAHSRAVMFEYSTDVYSQGTISRLARQYEGLLKTLARSAHEPLNLATSIEPAELQLIREVSQGPRIARDRGTLVDLLTPTFERSTASIAVRCSDEVWTYGELRSAVLQTAAALRIRGIGRGALVGLCLERSPRMLVAMLAVLETGAAYVPLDPAYPAERLAYMARDASIALLLHDSGLPPEVVWPPLPAGTLDVANAIAGNHTVRDHDDHAVSGPRPMDPAYVIYTSGSTGAPKGVVVPHYAVVNFLRSMAREPGLTAGDRLLAITTLSFDIAVLELLLPLFIGAKIVLATTPETGDGEQLQQLLARRRITMMQATPSTWRLLIDSGWVGTPGLRALVGGEELTRELAIQLRGRCAEVWNMYGPTEATVWATCHRVDEVGRGRVPIGKPIANVQAVVLDDSGNLCPVGVPGEIHLGGDCLAAGYLGQPDLTARRFVPNRYSRDRRAGRLYRTGDRGRFREDGVLEHLGRTDSQLKLRGHRIEPGEIESRLRQVPGIVEAAVLGIELGRGDVRLTAYVVCPTREHGQGELRAILRGWLPEYMVPQHFVFVDTVPLTPNGKVNRSALPRPTDLGYAGAARVSPRNRTESLLWDTWRETIGSDSFGVTDNFFEIGGHSLLAVQLVNRIRDRFGVQCGLSTLFRNPTIEDLCGALRDAAADHSGAAIPLNATHGVPNLFCIAGVSLYQNLADQLEGSRRVLGVHVPSELAFLRPDAAPEQDDITIEALATEYLRLIRAQQGSGPYALCGFSFGGVIAFELARQLQTLGEAVSELWVLDSDVPGVAATPGLNSLRAGVRNAARRVRGALTAGAEDASPTSIQRNRYLMAMHHYRPASINLRMVLVQSREPPTYDGGRSWGELAASVKVLRAETDHLGVLTETGVTQWLPAALADAAPDRQG